MFGKLFGSKKQSDSQSPSEKPAAPSYNQPSIQLPNNLVNPLFGEVNVQPLSGGKTHVVATILMDPVKEGTQTGVAIDGSGTMQTAFGKTFNFVKNVPGHLENDYRRKGWVKDVVTDGKRFTIWTNDALHPLEQQGYVKWSPNDAQTVARQVVPYLASNLDADGGTTVIYWACGQRGDQVEVIGDYQAAEIETLKLEGPSSWGGGTHLLPAMKYFLERFKDAEYGFYVFLTDGRLDDLNAVKRYTQEVTAQMAKKQRNLAKGVLIGIGSEVDEAQMEELDDLESDYDFWDHKIAKTMRDVRDIFAEVVDENIRVAEWGNVYNDQNQVVQRFSDGLPSIIEFDMPSGSTSFRLEYPGGEVTQTIKVN